MRHKPPQSKEASAPRTPLWPRLETGGAILLTLWAVVLHAMYLTHAGPLWRDEIGTIDFAEMSSLHVIWENLRYDNFPPLFVLLARLWNYFDFFRDFDYRILGFLIGLITLAVIWIAGKVLNGRPPLLILAFYAISPLAIRIGDAMRPYGLGFALILLTMAFIGRFAVTPKRGYLIGAIITAVLSVQTLYQCAFFLVVFSIGAWTMTLWRKDWKATWQVGLTGFIAALSLLPHYSNLKKGQEWLMVAFVPVDWAGIWKVLNESLSAGGDGMKWVWFAVFLGAAAYFFAFAWRKKNGRVTYAGVVLLAATATHLIFLRTLGLPLRSWYFLILLAVAALAIDVIFGEVHWSKLQPGRLILAVLIVVFGAMNSWTGVQLRHTNMDLIAAKLNQNVQAGDFVLVSPWYYGVSLQRYYNQEFTSLPPMTDLRIHRYDMMRDAMDSPDPIGGLKKKLEETLRAGRTVWVVGMFNFLQPGQAAIPLPEHRAERGGDSLYFSNWMFQLSGLVSTHALKGEAVEIKIPDNQAVDPVENPSLLAFQGWHD